MRLEGHMKCGFFPTPPDVTAQLRRLVRLPEEPFSALDPCAGEGVALANLVKGSGAVTYGIELDRRRASRARPHLDHVIRSDFFRCRVSPKSASLILLNPPYADDDDGRLEFRFLKAALPVLKPGGVLVYLIPQRRLNERVA
jgi:tRNA1(Val) A37 N6-methylase TrmN6